jgi:hypothetical protein
MNFLIDIKIAKIVLKYPTKHQNITPNSKKIQYRQEWGIQFLQV